MVVATYNAASVRARLPLILDWLERHRPDILCLQETKVEDERFPTAEFEDLGYWVALNGQKSWNGVATLARNPMRAVRKGFADDLMPEDARLLTCEVEGITVINSYVPNGSAVGTDKFDYKLRWLERFRQFLCDSFTPDQPLLWMADVNIAPTRDDVYNPVRFYGKVGHHPEEFKRLQAIVQWGLTDLYRKFHQGPGHYTYWDFVIPNSLEKNYGWRIDHIYGTAQLADRCSASWIDREARTLEKPSDHTFVLAELS